MLVLFVKGANFSFVRESCFILISQSRTILASVLLRIDGYRVNIVLVKIQQLGPSEWNKLPPASMVKLRMYNCGIVRPNNCMRVSTEKSVSCIMVQMANKLPSPKYKT